MPVLSQDPGGSSLLYIGKKRELVNYFKNIPPDKKQSLYRGVRTIISMLAKISKMTELHSINDKIFDELTETMKQNLDIIHNTLPYFSVSTKKVGFYYQEKRIQLFDDNERKFSNIFLTNKIKDIYFIKGITENELRKFFTVIKETLHYTLLDYDFNTKLWDYGITYIGTISDSDTGVIEPWTKEGFGSEFVPWSPEKISSLSSRSFSDLPDIASEFDNVGKTKESSFVEWVEKRGRDYTVQKYLDKATSIIHVDPGNPQSIKLTGKICEYGIRNLQDGDFLSGVVYINTIINMAKELQTTNKELFDSIKNVLTRLTGENFINKTFEAAQTMDEAQIKSFCELLTLISTKNFELIFLKIVDIKSKEIRLPALEAIAKNFKDIILAEKLIRSDKWYVVRNFVYLLRFVYDERLLPFVKEVMNHEVRQIRVEAARVLSLYNADDNLPYWEKAVFSPDEEVRLLAVENLVKVTGMESKPILNEIFRPANRDKFNLTDYERYIDRILESRRKEFFDLPGSLIFSSNKELRLITLKCLNKIEDPFMISSQLIRRIKSKDFLTLDKNEIELILGLVKGQNTLDMLDALSFVFKLRGGFFNRKKYYNFKKTIFDHMKNKSSPNIKKWIEKAAAEGDKETKNIIKGR